MARRHTPLQQFKEAQEIAKTAGLFVLERGGKFQVYRKNPQKNIYLGTRATAEGLRQYVAKLANFH